MTTRLIAVLKPAPFHACVLAAVWTSACSTRLPRQAAPGAEAGPGQPVEAPSGTPRIVKPVKPRWKTIPHVEYVHSACARGKPVTDSGCSASFQLTLRDGEFFSIVILDTDTLHFTYALEAFARSDTGQKLQGGTEVHDTLVLYRQHEKRYGGYILRVTRKDDPSNARGDALLTINVVTREWALEFAGGFTVSGLKDRVYSVRNDTLVDATTEAKTPVLRIQRQRDRENQQSLGLGSFVHLYNTGLPWLGISFGLGLEQSRAASYYFGPSIRLGGKATLTAGVLWGNVKTLPAGFAENQVVADANVINGTGTRTQHSLFAGISYSFIGGADKALAKPFAEQGASPAPSTTPSDAAATDVVTAITPVDTVLFDEEFQAEFLSKAGSQVGKAEVVFFATDTTDTQVTEVTFDPAGDDATFSAGITPETTGKVAVTVSFSKPGTFHIHAKIGTKDLGALMMVIVQDKDSD
jgi:hypothetical protein